MINRRQLLAGASASLLAAPAIVRAAGSQGQLNLLGWGGYGWDPVFDAFEAETGIKINNIGQPNADSIVAQAKLLDPTGGADLAEPMNSNAMTMISQDLIQPIDESEVDFSKYIDGLPGTVAGDTGHYDGKRWLTPILWGTEGMIYAEGDPNAEYGTASLEHLLDPKYEGQANVAAPSMLVVIARIMEARGELPFPLLDAFKDEAKARAVFDAVLPVAVANKKQVGQFFTAENDAMGGFLANGCTIGYNWESTGRMLFNDGFHYVAPKEGSTAWCQALMLLKNAKNVDAAYEYIRFQQRPEISAQYATISNVNPVVKGSAEMLPDDSKEFLAQAFPGDAVENFWWLPALDDWTMRLLGEYIDKWLAA